MTVEQPLRLRVYPDRKIPDSVFKKAQEKDTYLTALARLDETVPLDDWTKFAKALNLKAALLKKIRPYITEKDPNAKAIEGEADADLRSVEFVPFNYEGGITAFFATEVAPYAPGAWVDEKATKLGYEISFAKYFSKPDELREMGAIAEDLKCLENEASGMLAEILGGLS